jgi:hypothetical protein
MAIARASISPAHYSGSFVQSAWASRASMGSEERHGLAQFLYITCCAGIEVVLSEYLTAVLSWPAIGLGAKDAKLFKARPKQLEDGTTVDPDERLMNDAVHRLLKRTQVELSSAPFGRLMDLHVTILGLKPTEILSPKIYTAVQGLVCIRNLLAHSRQLYVDLVRDPAGGASLLPDSNFDSHPLKSAFSALAEAGLYSPQALQRPDGIKDLLMHIYREDVQLYFWNAAADAIDIYLSLASAKGFLDEKAYKRLPRLAA